MNANQINALGMIRGATGRQVIDRRLATLDVETMFAASPDLDQLLELGLVVYKAMRLDVGRGQIVSVPGLYLTAAGRRAEVAALLEAQSEQNAEELEAEQRAIRTRTIAGLDVDTHSACEVAA